MTATTPVRSRRPSRLWITLTALVVLIAGVSIAATAFQPDRRVCSSHMAARLCSVPRG